MTDKTPEELAEDHIRVKRLFIDNECTCVTCRRVRKEWIALFVAGYHSRDAEVKDLESRLAVAEEIHHD